MLNETVCEDDASIYSEPALVEYKNARTGKTEKGEFEEDSYEKPVLVTSLKDKIPVLPPRVPRRRKCSEGEVTVPVNKPRKDDIWYKIKDKTRLGFDEVRDQLLKSVKTRATKATNEQSQQCSASDLPNQPVRLVEKEGEEHSRGLVTSGRLKKDREKNHKRLSKVNSTRPLPEIPLTPQEPSSEDKRIRADGDTIDMYDTTDGKPDPYDTIGEVKVVEGKLGEGYLCIRSIIETSPKLEIYSSRTDTLKHSPYSDKNGRENQTKVDFYEYTVKELTECLKTCGLDKMATVCYEHKLDGAFFKNFSLESLLEAPFSLNKIEMLKMKKIIEENWRPKLDQ